MNTVTRELERIHARYPPVDQRVNELLASIRHACRDLGPRADNAGNERQLEEFATRLAAGYPGRTYEVTRGPPGAAVAPDDARIWETARKRTDRPCVVIERQRLSAWAVRTTRWNYVCTVPGDSTDQVVLVAHYDTWRGPGADDNTTGEEILKQYLLTDLAAAARPPLTHVYFFAGSEECGLVGLMSQLLLSVGLFAGNFALTYRDWAALAVAVALLPLASYRFGVAGSREYVRALSDNELRRIRAVISVDSVGEGRLYIPRHTMGADFIRVLVPFGDYDSLSDLLEEGAHLHGVKYNNFLAGGTTDHLSFLEVNNGLWFRAKDGLGRLVARLTGRAYTPPFEIPASALVAMLPGKASPIVFGGKIHTRNDTPDRVYPEPLRETLLILDYVFYRLDGGPRLREPRRLDEFHYARLYESDGEHLVAFKDAVEHNQRNLNTVYRAAATVDGRRATARLGEILSWGVEPRLRDEVAETCAELGRRWARAPVDELEVEGADGVRLRFARHMTPLRRLAQWYHRGVAGAQTVVRNWLFFSFFGLAYLLGQLVSWGFDVTFERWPTFGLWVADNTTVTLALVVVIEVAILLHLMARRIPAWLDNGYRHENRADNMGSLKRTGAQARQG